jgi:transposase-like protein
VHPGADRATPEGRKELVGFTDGARESAQDWRDLLLERKRSAEARRIVCAES